jgi:hypothetical protein
MPRDKEGDRFAVFDGILGLGKLGVRAADSDCGKNQTKLNDQKFFHFSFFCFPASAFSVQGYLNVRTFESRTFFNVSEAS